MPSEEVKEVGRKRFLWWPIDTLVAGWNYDSILTQIDFRWFESGMFYDRVYGTKPVRKYHLLIMSKKSTLSYLKIAWVDT